MSAGSAAAVEARVRRVVADTLGVGDDDLTPEVSLADDLAADSLDLVEMAVALERELEIALPDRVLAGVRTFGELLATALAVGRGDRLAATDAPPVRRRRTGAGGA